MWHMEALPHNKQRKKPQNTIVMSHRNCLKLDKVWNDLFPLRFLVRFGNDKLFTFSQGLQEI